MKKIYYIIILICFISSLGYGKDAHAAAIELFSTPLYSDANLKYYWRLEGNSNGSVGGVNGTDTNVTYGSTYGKFGQGASFNGVSSKIFTGNLTPGSNWTVNFWYKPATINTGKIPISMDTVSGSQRIWDFTHNASNQVYVDAWASDGTYYGQTPTASGMSAGTYYMITITWDQPNNALTLYRDTTSVVSKTIGSKNARTTATPMGIGARPFGTGDQWSDGSIDDVAYFDDVLTSTEISNLFNGTWPTTTSNVANILFFE